MIVLLNGKLIDEQKAVVSVYDHGFLYGMGLFETFRTYGGEPFLLERHVRRLEAGCRDLGIGYTPDAGEIAWSVRSLLEANHLKDAYIRWTVTAGEGILGLPAGEYDQPNVIGYIKELPAVNIQPDAPGKTLQLLKLRRNSPEGEVRHKSLHYMNNILGKRELSAYTWAKQAEGLFLDERGYVAEGLVSNLFFIKNGVCCTPSLDTGILPGITREFVLELAESRGMRTEQGLYRWEELLEADEVFMTNSIQEIVPVTSIYDTAGTERIIGSRQAGAVTAHLLEQYRAAACAKSSIGE
nr:aminodeoxychorismate lyase [Paenibacillus thalictri]